MKVFLCGEEKAPFPIKAEDAEAALKTEYIQLVPGSKDIEGRQARVWGMCYGTVVLCFFLHTTCHCLRHQSPWSNASGKVRCWLNLKCAIGSFPPSKDL